MSFDIDPKDENYERDLMIDEIKKLQNDLALKSLEAEEGIAAFENRANDMTLTIHKLTEQRDALLRALKNIACFDDNEANLWLELHNSYALFIDAKSVKIARAAITAVENK